MKMINDETENFNDPLWYKDCIIYQLNVKSYRDSNVNGIGDFKGLIQKLDYIQNLGITAIWLLPFYPSPLKDDGYDISDYFNIHTDYGTIDDFKEFLESAHERHIKIIIELVINHTSDQHPWFKRARVSEEGSKYRDYYVWSNDQERYKDARIIFHDFENSNWTWDPIAKAYYWHRFFSHQPDLNFGNPSVIREIYRTVDYWFSMGVDGMRLDAIPYLFEKEGTNCENLPETHKFLKNLNLHVKNKFRNKMLLAEANQWPEDAVAYFGSGDESQMAFHFPLMPRFFIAIQMEERFPIIDIMEQTPAIPEECQWVMFLRNHDELTLEMVTDEERDYMYRFYAKDKRARINLGIRRRLAPLIENDRRKIELLNILLLSFKGTPIIYYGDEIGMGDNYYLGDRNGVRTPMQWSSDTNAGFSEANPQELFLPIIIDPEYHYEAINVRVQQRNTSSLLWWMKRAIAIRKSHKAFSRGSIEFLYPVNSRILAFIRKYEDEIILIVVNLSKFSQAAELDMSKYIGFIPVDMFSGNKFPIIKESNYILTLSSHDYYWFVFHEHKQSLTIKERNIPEMLFSREFCQSLNAECKRILLDYLRLSWKSGTALMGIQDISLLDRFTIDYSQFGHYFFIVKVTYTNTLSSYLPLTLAISSKDRATNIISEYTSAILANLESRGHKYIVYESIYGNELRKNLFMALLKSSNIKCSNGQIKTSVLKGIKKLITNKSILHHSRIYKEESSFISILFSDSYLLKIYSRIENDPNPDIELVRTLAKKTNFKNGLQYAGEISYLSDTTPELNIGIIQKYVHNEGTAWHYMLNASKHHYENTLSKKIMEPGSEKISNQLFDYSGFTEDSISHLDMQDKINFEMVALLGKRTAELHFALAGVKDDDNFVPELYTSLYQRSIYQTIWSLTKNSFRLISLDSDLQALFSDTCKIGVNDMEVSILKYIKELLKFKIMAKKIRIHGDYHLGHILFTGKDFIIDFEGNSEIPYSDRRLKRSALRDVAAMIWSFHFAAYTAMHSFKQANVNEEKYLEMLAEKWWVSLCNDFLFSYIRELQNTQILPDDNNLINYLITIFLLERIFTDIMRNIKNDQEKLIENFRLFKYLQKEFL
jgi:maltose alpha-D-glucosyltransferase/alpha-amylase